ncbi:MAG: RNA pseudouridine synthase [Candidatus Omnitrophica bacterium]|nr:RNA pseudouridine synthase [Candidatus Omnitrophota bacterium]
MAGKTQLEIIYEDDYLVLLNKPSNLLATSAPGEACKNAVFLLNEQLTQRGINTKVYPCHRLDKETSGIMVFAKGKKMQEAVMDEFRQKKIYKSYIAFAHGRITCDKGMLKSYLKGAWPYNLKEKGKLAETRFQVIYRHNDFTVLKVEPLTGRTNQIRIQFSDYKHPLLGERRFALAREWEIKFKRTALHASGIMFIHPVHKRRIALDVPLPGDMENFLKKYGIFLKNYRELAVGHG